MIEIPNVIELTENEVEQIVAIAPMQEVDTHKFVNGAKVKELLTKILSEQNTYDGMLSGTLDEVEQLVKEL